MQQRRIATITSILLAIAFAAGPPSQPGVALADDDEGVRVLTPKEALEADLRLTAETNGWTLQEARTRYEASRAVARVSTKVAKRFPDIWIGSQVADDPGDPPILFLKGPVSDAVREIVDSEDIRIVIKDDQPYSYDELIERRDRVHDALMNAGYDEVATRVNITGGGIIPAGVRVTQGLKSDRESVLAVVPKGLRADVRLTVHEESLFGEDHALGGQKMTQTGDPPSRFCTSGFTVIEYSTMRTGVIGAGHCVPMNRLSSDDHVMYQQGHRYGSNGDIAWWTTNTVEEARFYSGANTINLVGWVADPPSEVSVGDTVCLWGRGHAGEGEARDCVKIADKSISCGGLTNMVLVTKDVGIGGDSGGPWFYGGAAYGVHHGKCSDSHPQDAYTPAWNVDNVFDSVAIALHD